MSIEEHDKIDFIGVEGGTGKVVLTISDHLDWEPPEPHMGAIQEKLNGYLRFVESGEIYEAYPDATGRSIAFDLVMRVPPSAGAKAFLERVRTVVEGAGFEWRTRVVE